MKKSTTKTIRFISRQADHLMKFACFLLAFALMHLTATAQTTKVSGRVTNAQGQPVGAVTVHVKNSSTSTSTGSDGFFTITAGSADVLEFTSVGFKSQDVPISGRTDVQVTIQQSESNTLGDVVVVGYTAQRKRDLTGSVSTVSTKDIVGLPVGGVDQILQGKVSGVTITQNTGAPAAVLRYGSVVWAHPTTMILYISSMEFQLKTGSTRYPLMTLKM